MTDQDARTVEEQYDDCLRIADEFGIASLGVMTNQVWHDDPKRLTFVLARYKFVAKMFSGMDKVLEVGCADAFATRQVQQEVKHVTALDIDPVFVEDVKKRMSPKWPMDVDVHNMLDGAYLAEDGEGFDGAYSLDVLEHIEKDSEGFFVQNIANSLSDHGTALLGMPSLNSQAYASPQSKVGHINCKQGPEFKELMEQYFHNVFIFSMNDEVVHTGFHHMAHYLFALCCGPKRDG